MNEGGDIGESTKQENVSNGQKSREHKEKDAILEKKVLAEKARTLIEMGEATLAGHYDADYSLVGREKSTGRESDGEADASDFVLFDENSQVQQEVLQWVAEKLGLSTSDELKKAPVLQLPYDQHDAMKMEVMARRFGEKAHPWFIARYFQKDASGQLVNPLYVLRSGQQISEQVDTFQEFQEARGN